MSRRPRSTPGGFVYHVYNRGSRKGELFETDDDYREFEQLLESTRLKRPIRAIAYCLMRTHFHLVLWPEGDVDVPRFMQQLTGTHAIRWHRRRGSRGTGAVYQSRYRSKPISDTRHYFAVLRYVERNALAAGIVPTAQAWRWGSACDQPGPARCVTLDPGPVLRPSNWQDLLNLD